MSKVFDFNNIHEGSYIDGISGAQGSNTNGVFRTTSKGLAWKGNGSTNIAYGASMGLSLNDFTVVCNFKLLTSGINHLLFAWGEDSAGKRRSIWVNSVNVLYWSGYGGAANLSSGVTLDVGKWYQAIISITDADVVTIYVNNPTLVRATASVTLATPATNTLYIGANPVGGESATAYIQTLQVYSGILPTQERNNLYNEFLQSKPKGRKIVNPIAYDRQKEEDLSREVDSVVGDTTVVNGNFANWTADDPDDWDVTETSPNSEITEAVGGNACRMVSDGTNVYMRQTAGSMVAGKKYLLLYDVVDATVGIINVGDNLDERQYGLTMTAVGSFVNKITAVGTKLHLSRQSGATDITFTNIKLLPLSGIIAAYTFKRGSLLDVSGNGHDFTAYTSGVISILNGISLNSNGYGQTAVTSDLRFTKTDAFAIFIRFKQTASSAVTRYIVNNRKSDGAYSYHGWLASLLSSDEIGFGIGYYDGSSRWIDVKTSQTFNDNLWHNVLLVNEGTGENTGMHIYVDGIEDTVLGANETTAMSYTVNHEIAIGADNSGVATVNKRFIGELDNILIYNTEKVLQDAINYHNPFANQLTFKSNELGQAVGNAPDQWQGIGVTGGVPNTVWDELTTADSVLGLPIGTKVHECNVSDHYNIPSTQAFGTWKFLVKRNASSNSYFAFLGLGDTISSYSSQYIVKYNVSTLQLDFRKTNNAGVSTQLWVTPNGVVTDGEWSEFTVYRLSSAGKFPSRLGLTADFPANSILITIQNSIYPVETVIPVLAEVWVAGSGYPSNPRTTLVSANTTSKNITVSLGAATNQFLLKEGKKGVEQ